MRQRPFLKFTCILLLFSLMGCVNLEAVSDFSVTSAEALSNYENLSYGFKQYCEERCEFNAIQQSQIKRTLDCDCRTYAQADSVSIKIYNSILGYFTSLGDIAGLDVSGYNLDAVNKPLQEGTFGKVIIQPEQADAYSSISNLLFRASTDVYKRKKIKEYIKEANAPLQLLLDKFSFILGQNLKEELDFKKERLYAFYTELKLNDGLSDFEKVESITSYYDQLLEIDHQQEKLEIYAASLKEIAMAHQELYDKRSALSTDVLKQEMSNYGSALRDMGTAFKKLKE
ncbi:hypothetical protein ACH3O9_01595 [Leeuwenhoekiella sp. A16]|uniref:hypothetical protein n=1 Tax=unclassified Leeuwenhoekiella TaxID=2615029 RepID=UPI003A7FA1BA